MYLPQTHMQAVSCHAWLIYKHNWHVSSLRASFSPIIPTLTWNNKLFINIYLINAHVPNPDESYWMDRPMNRKHCTPSLSPLLSIESIHHISVSPLSYSVHPFQCSAGDLNAWNMTIHMLYWRLVGPVRFLNQFTGLVVIHQWCSLLTRNQCYYLFLLSCSD